MCCESATHWPDTVCPSHPKTYRDQNDPEHWAVTAKELEQEKTERAFIELAETMFIS